MRKAFHLPTLATSLALLACSSAAPAGLPPGTQYTQAEAVADPPPAAPKIIHVPPAVTLPGQLKRVPATRSAAAPTGPVLSKGAKAQQAVAAANLDSQQRPDPDAYFNAILQYTYEPGSLYQVYAAPMRVTDITLEPGEKIVGQPASGDVVRWVLALGKSLKGGVEQWHVYLKPTRADLETNLAINTDRRSYLLELHSYPDTYMAAVEWHYPQDEMARLTTETTDTALQQQTSAPVVSLDALNFDLHHPSRPRHAPLDPGPGLRRRTAHLSPLPRGHAGPRGARPFRPPQQGDAARQLPRPRRLLRGRPTHRRRRAARRSGRPGDRPRHPHVDDPGDAAPSIVGRPPMTASAPTEPADPHRSKISPDDPRLRLGRERGRTLRAGPILGLVIAVLGVVAVALVIALQPATPAGHAAPKSDPEPPRSPPAASGHSRRHPQRAGRSRRPRRPRRPSRSPSPRAPTPVPRAAAPCRRPGRPDAADKSARKGRSKP